MYSEYRFKFFHHVATFIKVSVLGHPKNKMRQPTWSLQKYYQRWNRTSGLEAEDQNLYKSVRDVGPDKSTSHVVPVRKSFLKRRFFINPLRLTRLEAYTEVAV